MYIYVTKNTSSGIGSNSGTLLAGLTIDGTLLNDYPSNPIRIKDSHQLVLVAEYDSGFDTFTIYFNKSLQFSIYNNQGSTGTKSTFRYAYFS